MFISPKCLFIYRIVHLNCALVHYAHIVEFTIVAHFVRVENQRCNHVLVKELCPVVPRAVGMAMKGIREDATGHVVLMF